MKQRALYIACLCITAVLVRLNFEQTVCAQGKADRDRLVKSLNLSSKGVQPVGEQAMITVNTYNLKTLHFHAYDVPLDTILNQPKYLNSSDFKTITFRSVFGGPRDVSKLEPQVAEWDYTAPDRGDNMLVSDTVKTPITKTGAYIVEAENDDRTVSGATLMVVSDIVVVRKMVNDTVLAFVANAKTGQPIAGAKVCIRQLFVGRNPATGQNEWAVVNQGQTDIDGVYSVPLQHYDIDTLKRVEIFADASGSRYALSFEWVDYRFDPQRQSDRLGPQSQPNEIKGYCYTDRTVYRPGQTVCFRDIIGKFKLGETNDTPYANQPIEVKVVMAHPEGVDIYGQKMTTDEFGSIQGMFTLPKNTPSGLYSVDAEYTQIIAGGSINTYPCGNVTFQVNSEGWPTIRAIPFVAVDTSGEDVTNYNETETVSRHSDNSRNIMLLTDRSTYDIGETAHLTIATPEPDTWVFLTQETGEQILRHDLVHIVGQKRTVNILIVRADSPNFVVTAIALRDNKFFQGKRELSVPPTQQFLTLTVSSDKTTSMPYKTGVLHIKSLDAQGNPVSAELSLAITGLPVAPVFQADPDIRVLLYGDKRQINVDAASSENEVCGSAEEYDPVAQDDWHHEIDMPDDDLYQYTVGSSGPFSIAGEEETEFPGLIGGRPFDPSNGYVHLRGSDENLFNSQIDSKGLRQESKPPDSPETAFWAPAIITDPKNGVATVRVKLPNTQTTWRVRAIGATKTMLVGTGETSVTVTRR